ncbi:MAG: hypothetical protein ACRC1H_12390, partial [Caldilineaceae bacterium]
GDQAPRGFFDARRPGLLLNGPFLLHPILPDAPATTLTARINIASYTRSTAKGILLIHHHNANSSRAEAVDVRYAWPVNLRLPIVRNE